MKTTQWLAKDEIGETVIDILFLHAILQAISQGKRRVSSVLEVAGRAS